MTQVPVFITVLLICFGVSHAFQNKTTEDVKDRVVIVGKPLNYDASMEDLEAKGKALDDECFDGVCFKVMTYPECYHDHDCTCPTNWYYYTPSAFTDSNGVRWEPISGQSARVGVCHRYGICYKKSWPFEYQYCNQWWKSVAFLYYSVGGFFQVKLQYLNIPDYCYCPCGTPFCPLGQSGDN